MTKSTASVAEIPRPQWDGTTRCQSRRFTSFDDGQDKQHHAVIEELIAVAAARGDRAIGVGTQTDLQGSVLEPGMEAELVFEGLLLFSDPPKADIAATLTELAALGVVLKVVTGDSDVVARRWPSLSAIAQGVREGRRTSANTVSPSAAPEINSVAICFTALASPLVVSPALTRRLGSHFRRWPSRPARRSCRRVRLGGRAGVGFREGMHRVVGDGGDHREVTVMFFAAGADCIAARSGAAEPGACCGVRGRVHRALRATGVVQQRRR